MGRAVYRQTCKQARGPSCALGCESGKQINVTRCLGLDLKRRWVFKDNRAKLLERKLKIIIHDEVIEGVVLRDFIACPVKALLNGVEIILPSTQQTRFQGFKGWRQNKDQVGVW